MPSAARAYQACGMRLHRPTIVCGVDGSSRTGELVRIAARLADVLDTHLEVVHVLGASSQRPSLASAATTAGSGWAAGNVLTADVNDSELAAVAMLVVVVAIDGFRSGTSGTTSPRPGSTSPAISGDSTSAVRIMPTISNG